VTDWSEMASAIEAQLPSEAGFRVPLGEDLAERLRTYGVFRDELERERQFDEALAGTHAAEPVAPVPAVPAEVTIGGLRLVSRLPGTRGNGTAVTVSSGSAASFSVPQIDPALAEQHRQDAIRALDGTIISLSTDPTLAALQQQASAFLSSIDAETRTKAEALINERWLDYRNERAGIAIPREREKLESTLDAMVAADPSVAISATVKDAALRTWDARDASLDGAAARIMTLTVTREEVVETYPDIVPGYAFPIASSALLQEATWANLAAPSESSPEREVALAVVATPLSSPSTTLELEALQAAAATLRGLDETAASAAAAVERPANGTYELSGGTDGSPGRAGRKAPKPIGEYIFHVDAARVFTLEELREIVAQAIEGGREWLAA
jgi:hypothetical protein